MSVPVAYITIILIWATTPIGIAWSNETVSPFMAVLLRMAIATFVGLIVIRVAKIKLVWNMPALKTYSYSLLGVYVALTCTYIAAQSVPSGLISVVYALSPLVSTLLAKVMLGKGDFNLISWLSFLISFAGLGLIFFDDLGLEGQGKVGLFLLLFSVLAYSFGGVLIQKVKFEGHPLSITVGTLVMALPLFFMTWFTLDGEVPTIDWESKSPWAILYLAIFGSLIGFACYFLIVKELGATAVAMVTLMTPVIALTIGGFVNGETITLHMISGTFMVLIGLLLYYFSDEIGLRFRRKRNKDERGALKF